MNEQVKELKKELDELKAWKASLERSSSIPLAIDQAFSKRLGRPIFVRQTIDVGSLAAHTSASTTVNVPEAETGDPVLLGIPNAAASDMVAWVAWVSSTGIVTIRAINTDDTSSFDPGSGLFKIAVLKE